MLEKDEIETEQFRQKCLKKYKPFFDLNNKLFQLTDNMVNSGKIRRDSPLHDVMLCLFGKAHKTFQAVDILMQRGYGQDAAILTRSLFEILVNIKYLAKGDGRLVKKYLYFDEILRKRLVDKYKEDIKNGNIAPTEEVMALLNNKEKMEQLGKDYQEAKPYFAENRRKDTWSGEGIGEMAEDKDVGLYYEYNYVYWLLSHQVHSNAMSLRDYVNSRGEEPEFEIGPSASFFPEVFRFSLCYFLDILEVVNMTFQLGFEGQISEIPEEAKRIFSD